MPPFLRLKDRYAIILILCMVYVAICLITRLALLAYETDGTLYNIGSLARIFSVGLLYDLAAFSWVLLPFIVNALIWPNTVIGRRGHKWLAGLMLCALLGGLIFQFLAEFLFWNEFSSRFNFIAIDYLVYTREVVGNIWQSYPAELLLSLVGGVTVVAILIIAPVFLRVASFESPPFRTRGVISLGFVVLPLVFFLGLGETPHRNMPNPVERELASNGLYSLFRAFRNNSLDYAQFYATLQEREITDILALESIEAGLTPVVFKPGATRERDVLPDSPPLRKNIVLISVESLGSDYVEAFGGRPGLTPNLSRIAEESLTFHKLYATGLRTVRGLEALTLSIPPTPGRAVPIRTDNRGLQSLGSVLKQQGYDPLYLYGGYSFFDNMKDFFSGNGYEVLDRTDIDSDRIHHETIWGVADEDLFDMALEQLDQRSGTGRPFFAHIMTTSNHRPYTYPEGRIDIPSHTGRDGAVKYTDWAIGKFMKEAEAKTWYNDTLFVIVADHTSHGRGRTDLPPENYLIPLIIHAPGFIEPARVDSVASLIDVAPTVLGLLNVPYRSKFFGQDILREGRFHQRAFMANYLTVGYMENGLVVELAPQQRIRVIRASDGTVVPNDDPTARHYINEAISHYQTAAKYIELNAHAAD